MAEGATELYFAEQLGREETSGLRLELLRPRSRGPDPEDRAGELRAGAAGGADPLVLDGANECGAEAHLALGGGRPLSGPTSKRSLQLLTSENSGNCQSECALHLKPLSGGLL